LVNRKRDETEMPWFTENSFRLKVKKSVEPVAFTARIANKETLEKFDNIAIKAGYKRNELLNMVIEKFVQEARIIETDSQEDQILKEKYNDLDRLLRLHMNKEIKIGLNRDELGKEQKYYKLLDYNLSLNEKKLKLKFQWQDDNNFSDELTMTFENIYDIAYQGNGSVYKVWIYMPEENWRFYLK